MPMWLDLHRVVGHQAVAPLDQLHGGLALAHAGVAHEQHALAVHIHQHPVAGDAGRETGLEPVGEVGDEQGGVLLAAQDGPLVLDRHGHELREGLQAAGEDEGRDGLGQEGVKALLPLLRALVVQIRPLHLADDLDAVGGKVVKKAQDLQGGAVDVVGADEAPVVIFALVEHFQLEPLHQLGQFDCRLRCHGSSSSLSPTALPSA